MAAWAIVAVPLLIMFFALGMERVEARLSQVVVGENDVEEFLEQARPNEVRELFRFGIGRALELFRLRRRNRGRHAAPVTIEAGSRVPAGAATPRHGVPVNGVSFGAVDTLVSSTEVTTPLPVIPLTPDPVPARRPPAWPRAH